MFALIFVEQNAKLLPFFLCLSFRLKVKKRYLFLKKKSGISSFQVNDILTSILSALHPFLTLPNDVLKRKGGTFFSVSSDLMKGTKRYLFCSWKRCSQKREKSWQLEVMFLKVRKRYLYKVFKNVKWCFQARGSHLESYWLTDVNHLVSFYEFFCMNLLMH